MLKIVLQIDKVLLKWYQKKGSFTTYLYDVVDLDFGLPRFLIKSCGW